jgi:hypothetical protein
MRKYQQIRSASLVITGLLLLTFSVTLAQSPYQTAAEYILSWWTVDGGGDTVAGSGYTLSGTIGQPEPGPVLSGGDFTLTSGFWSGGLSDLIQRMLYLPFITR